MLSHRLAATLGVHTLRRVIHTHRERVRETVRVCIYTMSLAPASANEVGDAKDGERLLADIEHGGASSDAAEAHSGEREVVVQSRKQYAKDWKRPFLFANPTSSSTDGEFSKASVWLLIVFYIGLNCALNLTNRYALGMTAFNFPISLTCTHMVRKTRDIGTRIHTYVQEGAERNDMYAHACEK